MGGGPHGTELLNRHRFQTIFLKIFLFKYTFFLIDTLFLKDTFLKDTLFFKDTFFKYTS